MKHFSFKLLVLLFLSAQSLMAQEGKVERIEPPCWWTNMNNTEVELLVHGKNIADAKVSVSNYAGVKLKKVEKAENSNYLYVTLDISNKAKAGKMKLDFGGQSIDYELKNKEADKPKSVDASDFIYLLMPDRFANGDEKNDFVPGYLQNVQRDSAFARHGGDLQGVLNHLDYFQELGVTALWLCPEIENNQPKESYHGYAATDFYKIDPRIGTNELYKQYVAECHKKNIKIVKDVVFNHIGNEHWLYKDLPSKNWVHQFKEFTRTNYRAVAVLDPYASQADKDRMSDGWFDTHMPDLNQKDPHLAKYLIQNSLWWIAYSGLDCYRIDTYPYPDQDFMLDWGKAMLKEFPTLSIFGEIWDNDKVIQTYFAKSNVKTNPTPVMKGVTDFPLFYASQKAVNEDFGWDKGVMQWYYTLTQDYLYENAYNNVIFLDNHDIDRYYSCVGEDAEKLKMGLAFLLTTRGIPSIFYGTEILMSNKGFWGNHDKLRSEFPGGWKDNPKNKFTAEGRTEAENEIFNYVRTLANYRKNHSALQNGKLMQFVPDAGVYVYFRYNEKETVMVIENSNKTESKVNTARFAERMKGFSSAKNIHNNQIISNLSEFTIPAKTAWVLELK